MSFSPVIETLRSLVAINSVNSFYEGGPGEREIAAWVRRFFEERGIEVWEQEVFPNRPNVIARLPGRDASRRVILEAHMDTVSVHGMSIPPFEPRVEDGKLFGRGSCDTKAGLAAMMHAGAALREEGVTPPCEVWLAAVVDEEFSARGIARFCEELTANGASAARGAAADQGASAADTMPLTHGTPAALAAPAAHGRPSAEAALVAEPTNLRAIVASKGVLRWRIVVRGKAAHSSKPHLGVNAIGHAARIVLAIEQDHARLAAHAHPLLGPATVNVGIIHGGVQVNFVPDACAIEMDRRLLPGENAPAVLAHYQRLLDELKAQHPTFDAVMEPPMLVDEALEIATDSAPAQLASALLAEMGLDAAPGGVPFGSDASKLSRAGIPSLIIGPGSIDQAHAAVEFVEIAEVERALTFYREFIRRFE